MSADAASLPCPICSHTGVFHSVQSLRDRLIHISTNKILCPVCQEEVSGLDKLTIHLFSHVKLLTVKHLNRDEEHDIKIKSKTENTPTTQNKKTRPTTAKNKPLPSSLSAPVKYVKIYPKLPVISLNSVPVIDISERPVDECIPAGEKVYVKTETTVVQTNTTCNICGLQFVDASILRMHRCLIHNVDENVNQNFTRHQCHLCPKKFKMRGSLMVHLRVAHYGFLSGNSRSDANIHTKSHETTFDSVAEDQPTTFERNDNKQWQCDVCRKCFTTKYFLKKHKRLHTGETPYACTQCNKTFTFQQSYHKHLLYHNDEKPHTCSFCGRAFKELSTLHNHQRIHTGEKPFSCETCGKCFRQRVSYLVHRRIHTGVMPYKCTACEKSFRYKVSQRTHKCQAQPPGTVVRQIGDLVEKLKKKHGDPDPQEQDPKTDTVVLYPEVSEANAELVRTGAKLSLEDMESDSFSFITGAFQEIEETQAAAASTTSTAVLNDNLVASPNDQNVFSSNIEELIETIPIEDKNIPSPSEILKNLCLSNEEDIIGIFRERDEDNTYDLYKEFNTYL